MSENKKEIPILPQINLIIKTKTFNDASKIVETFQRIRKENPEVTTLILGGDFQIIYKKSEWEMIE